jgi:hypothetical protein
MVEVQKILELYPSIESMVKSKHRARCRRCFGFTTSFAESATSLPGLLLLLALLRLVPIWLEFVGFRRMPVVVIGRFIGGGGG